MVSQHTPSLCSELAARCLLLRQSVGQHRGNLVILWGNREFWGVEWVGKRAAVIVKSYVGTSVKFGKDQTSLILLLVEQLISLSPPSCSTQITKIRVLHPATNVVFNV